MIAEKLNELYAGLPLHLQIEVMKAELMSWRKTFNHPHPYASVCEDLEREGDNFITFAEREIMKYEERFYGRSVGQ